MTRYRRRRGFTLIEVMITVAIIGILAAIAVPAYTEYVQRGWRADARTALLENAQFMQRLYAQNFSYALGALTLPAVQSPATGAARYTIALSAGTATTFTLTATPAGWTDGRCGALGLDHLGQKTAAAAGADLNYCWGR